MSMTYINNPPLERSKMGIFLMRETQKSLAVAPVLSGILICVIYISVLIWLVFFSFCRAEEAYTVAGALSLTILLPEKSLEVCYEHLKGVKWVVSFS